MDGVKKEFFYLEKNQNAQTFTQMLTATIVIRLTSKKIVQKKITYPIQHWRFNWNHQEYVCAYSWRQPLIGLPTYPLRQEHVATPPRTSHFVFGPHGPHWPPVWHASSLNNHLRREKMKMNSTVLIYAYKLIHEIKKKNHSNTGSVSTSLSFADIKINCFV